jgi:hypothetical protein
MTVNYLGARLPWNGEASYQHVTRSMMTFLNCSLFKDFRPLRKGVDTTDAKEGLANSCKSRKAKHVYLGRKCRRSSNTMELGFSSRLCYTSGVI